MVLVEWKWGKDERPAYTDVEGGVQDGNGRLPEPGCRGVQGGRLDGELEVGVSVVIVIGWQRLGWRGGDCETAGLRYGGGRAEACCLA